MHPGFVATNPRLFAPDETALQRCSLLSTTLLIILLCKRRLIPNFFDHRNRSETDLK
jgi:hypothetical protein